MIETIQDEQDKIMKRDLKGRFLVGYGVTLCKKCHSLTKLGRPSLDRSHI